MKYLLIAVALGLQIQMAWGMVAHEKRRWQAGQTITFIFMPNIYGESVSENRQRFIRQYALEWTKYANLKFEFIDGSTLTLAQLQDIKRQPDEYVLINFDKALNPNHFAEETLVGTSIYNINFPNTINVRQEWSQQDLFASTVIHEFGHLLGLLHEHQHPQRDFVFKSGGEALFCKDQGWEAAHCQHNVRKTLSGFRYVRTKYDPLSIMHYPMSSRYVSSRPISTNHFISWGDALAVAEFYPYPDITLAQLRQKHKQASDIHNQRIKFYDRTYKNGSTYAGGLSQTYVKGDAKWRKWGHGNYVRADNTSTYQGEYKDGQRHGYGISRYFNKSKQLNYATEGFRKEGRSHGCAYLEFGEGSRKRNGIRFVGFIGNHFKSSWDPLGEYGFGVQLRPAYLNANSNKKHDQYYYGEFNKNLRYPNGCGFVDWYGEKIWQGFFKAGRINESMASQCNNENFARVKKTLNKCLSILPPHSMHNNFIKVNHQLIK